MIGAYGDDADDGSGKEDTGSVYVFQLVDSTWTEHSKLSVSDAGAGDHFGAAVSMTADYGMVGAPGGDAGGQDAGTAYIYRREGSIWIRHIQLSDS